ncbi:MAG: hypothetical protein A3J93_03430 [Candidatus Magasanikbacteria bacterium RIFOXYC2_FULL_42_28]|uniref:FAD/NAD(P)-binding domain-containing protein n=1 Tax=Candidatus Magasanikbacteria bacterium RIFOXYC2_FULL_42_28 TaxID=1798704 RepID=A0A1F6NUQ9_9BACT|nr:MAG: hypothetical protein A3J93_03430 [Candidatus Magasanikbacteria bacterium RIFOXYC2_FULL_42_28]
MKKVIITGGGFAGITAGLKLLKNNFSVTMFNPRAVFEFSPLLPDALIKDKPMLAEFSFAPLLGYKNFQLLTEKVVGVDATTKIVRGEKSTAEYDYLLIATGMDGKMAIEGNEQNSILFKSVADVVKISDYLKTKIKVGGTIAVNIIGAGATGVETALALATYLKARTEKWQINLFHNLPLPINNNPAWLATLLVKIFKTHNINFIPNQTITRLCPEGVVCGTNLHNSELNILTAGGRANVKFCAPEFLDERGQIKVNEFLQTIDENIFAAGDVSNSPNLKTAQAAEYEGNLVAKNILAHAVQHTLSPNKFKMQGFLMMTGAGTAAGMAGPFRLNGRLGGLLRLLAYLKSLPGIKNRLKLLQGN